MYEIRDTTIEDIPCLVEIYNQKNNISIAPNIDVSLMDMERGTDWLKQQNQKNLPVYTCLYNNKNIGFIYLSQFKLREQILNHVARIDYLFTNCVQDYEFEKQLLRFIEIKAVEKNISVLIILLLKMDNTRIKYLNEVGFETWMESIKYFV